MSYVPPSGDNIVFDFPIGDYTPPSGDNVLFPDGSVVFISDGGGAVAGSPPDPLVYFPRRASHTSVGGSVVSSPTEPTVRYSSVVKIESSGGSVVGSPEEPSVTYHTINKAYTSLGGAVISSPRLVECFSGFVLNFSGSYESPEGSNLELLFGTVVLNVVQHESLGGAVSEGSSVSHIRSPYTSKEGSVSGGSAFVNRVNHNYSELGSVVGGSSETSIFNAPRIASIESIGGAICNSQTSFQLKRRVLESSTCAVIGGSSTHHYTRHQTSLEGSIVGGSAHLFQHNLIKSYYTSVGGSVVGGSANHSFILLQKSYLSSEGGILAGGSSFVNRISLITSEKGAIVGGSLSFSQINLQIEGIVSIGGSISGGSSIVKATNLQKSSVDSVIQTVSGGSALVFAIRKYDSICETIAGGSSSIEAINLQFQDHDSIGGALVGGSSSSSAVNLQISHEESLGGSVVGGSSINSFINLQISHEESLGGSVVGGEGSSLRLRKHINTVGSEIGGSAFVSRKILRESLGGAISGSSSEISTIIIQHENFESIGGAIIGGHATTNIPENIHLEGVGGSVVGSKAIIDRLRVHSSEGLSIIGGSSTALRTRQHTSTDGAVVDVLSSVSAVNLNIKDYDSLGGSVSSGSATYKYLRFALETVETIAGGEANISHVNLKLVSVDSVGGAIIGGEARSYIPQNIHYLSEIKVVAGGEAGHRIPDPLIYRYFDSTGGSEVNGRSQILRSRRIVSSSGSIGSGNLSYKIIAWGSGHYDVTVEYDQFESELSLSEFEGSLILDEIYSECVYGEEINLVSPEMNRIFLVENISPQIQCDLSIFTALTDSVSGFDVQLDNKELEVEIKLWPQTH